MKIMQKGVLLFFVSAVVLGIVVLGCTLSSNVSLKLDTRTKLNTIGVVRWDGQAGNLDSPVATEESIILSYPQFYDKLPFYAEVSRQGMKNYEAWVSQGRKMKADPGNPNDAANMTDLELKVYNAQQSIIDAEIAYAKAAGIDYWAFCWYGNDETDSCRNMSAARNLYLASKNKRGLQWCVILGTHPLSPNDADWLVEEMAKEDYFKIFGDRPLVYFGLWDGTDAGLVIKNLREKCQALGFDPYIAVFDAYSQRQAELYAGQGADALSYYTGFDRGVSESSVWHDADKYVTEINKKSDKKLAVIPQLTTGWNAEPRARRDIGREYKFISGGYEGGKTTVLTEDQMASHFGSAMTFNSAKSKVNENWPNTILIYSWNEFSECGNVLCPQFAPDFPDVPNTKVLDALAKAIAKAEKGPDGGNPSRKRLSFQIKENNNIKYPVVFDTNGGKFPTFRFDILKGEADEGWNEALDKISVGIVPENAWPYTIAKGGKIMPPQEMIPKKGYTFDGWYKDETLTMTWDFGNDTVQGNTVLYAKWK
jgi:uncharacterized repeat protein (TIGR02543 family)